MADIKDGYGLPDALPPLRLPSDSELAQQVRAIPLLRELAALAGWLGKDGKPVDAGEVLRKDARDEALTALDVSPERLRVLWSYALAVGWVTVGTRGDTADTGEDPADTGEDPAGTGEDRAGTGDAGEDGRRAFSGQTAATWASGIGADGRDPDDADALDAWASTFTAVLSEAIAAAAGELDGHEDLDVRVPGAVIALVLFLSRREGLFREDARTLVRDVLTGELPRHRAERAWHDWVSAHGDPADVLLGQLAEAGAVTLPWTDDGTIRFTPLALREMRLQLTDEGVDIPLLPASADELTAEQLLAMAEGVPGEEFEAVADAWLMVHGPDQSAALLLDLAAASDPAERLTAVSVVTRAGRAAEQAWEDHIAVPALRPYAKVALAGLALGTTPAVPSPTALALLPESIRSDTLPPELRPLPEDLAWLAADVLALACADEDTDPDEIAAAFAQSVPPGEEANALDRLWRCPHPDAERVLSHLGRFHPDKKIAKDARRAAHKAASRRDADGQP